MENILISSIDRDELDSRLRKTGLARDLEAEIDSRYVRVGDELTEKNGSLELKALPDDAIVPATELGLVFWAWVDDADAVDSAECGTERKSCPGLDYFSNVLVPFGEAINIASGSDDDGDYVAFAISYEELTRLLEYAESELMVAA